MRKLTVLLLILLTSLTLATDIKLKNGTIITNIEITKETDTYIEFMVKNSKKRIAKIDIEKIRISPVNKSRPERIFDNPQNNTPQKAVIGYYKPTYLLPVAALSFAVGINYLMSASDLSDEVDKLKKQPEYIKETTEKMENSITRYNTVGTITLLASAALVYYSFQDINIYAAPNKLQVSYKLD